MDSHTTPATTTTLPDASGGLQWQVVFLPTPSGDSAPAAAPCGYLAVCPYTGVVASGRSVLHAASRWQKAARETLGCPSIVVPRYLLTTRKVWGGEEGDGRAFYVIQAEGREVVVHPGDRAPVAGGRTGALEEAMLADWRVPCTPVMRASDDAAAGPRAASPSLTPHYIN
eukprot:m51a1_g10736 hypothetical protein (170) ;mRNA; f:305070-305645